MRRTVSCGLLVLSRIYGNDPEIAIAETNAVNPKEGKDKKKTAIQGRLIRGNTRDRMLAKVSRETVDIPRLTLPAIPLRNGPRVNNEERKTRRRPHCYDFSLQVQRVTPEPNKPRKSSTSTASSERSDASAKRLPYVIYDQNYGEYTQGEKSDLRNKRNFLPLSFGILEGQRMSLLQKEQLDKQQKRFKPSEKERRQKHKGEPLIWFF